MSLPITIPVFFHSDETETAEKIGIEYTVDQSEIRDVTFYVVDAVSTYIDHEDDKKVYGRVYSNGSQYITSISYPRLIELLK